MCRREIDIDSQRVNVGGHASADRKSNRSSGPSTSPCIWIRSEDSATRASPKIASRACCREVSIGSAAEALAANTQATTACVKATVRTIAGNRVAGRCKTKSPSTENDRGNWCSRRGRLCISMVWEQLCRFRSNPIPSDSVASFHPYFLTVVFLAVVFVDFFASLVFCCTSTFSVFSS